MYTHRNLNRIMVLLLMASMAICSTSCEKDNKGGGGGGSENVLLTLPATNVTNNSATLGGNILDSDFGYTEKGVCYSETSNPTTNDYTLAVFDDRITGTYTIIARDLSQKTTYYVRAYATNSTGTVYGNLISFTTLEGDEIPPPVITMPSEIVIDLSDLAALEVNVAVVSADEDLTFVKVSMQFAGTEVYVVENVLFEETITSWTKTYRLEDFPSIELIEPLKDADLTFCVETQTKNTDAFKSAPITIIGSVIPIPTPLEGPAAFTWERYGAAEGTGLDKFGLAWRSNTATNIVITPLAGTKLVELQVNDWNITTKEELIELVDNGIALSKWEVIPMKVTFNYVIATKTANGEYFLINPTARTVDPNDGGHRTVTGEYKY